MNNSSVNEPTGDKNAKAEITIPNHKPTFNPFRKLRCVECQTNLNNKTICPNCGKENK